MLRPTTQGGFTLVEVMVTVFIVAIGLLGATALQALSKKAAVDAMQRTTATVLAQDMLERIRSNSAQIANYIGDLSSAPSSAASCGAGAKCSATELASYDLAQWWDGLSGDSETINDNGTATSSGGLRSPVGCIRVNGAFVEVVVAWRGLTAITQGDSSNSSDPTNDSCGQTNSDYGATGGQSYRRVLRLQAHIN